MIFECYDSFVVDTSFSIIILAFTIKQKTIKTPIFTR